MPRFCPVSSWELSQGAQCQLRVLSSPWTALQGNRGKSIMEWHHLLPPAKVVPTALCTGPSHIAATAQGGQQPSDLAAVQGRSSDLQQLHPGLAGTGCHGLAEALMHLGTASVTSHVSSIQKQCQTWGISLPLVGFFFQSCPTSGAASRSLPRQAGRESPGAEPMPAPLSSACQGSPLPRVGDSSWGCQ